MADHLPTSDQTPEIPDRLGIDIDGVLADFTHPVAALATELFNLDPPVSGHATEWNWMRAYGVTGERESQLWAWITRNPEWWGLLPPLPYARMALAYLRESSAEVYFITSRPGHGVKAVTENWLRYHGYPDPTVLIASDKAPIVKALRIDVFVDDKPDTCAAVAAETAARVFMPDRPWNQGEVIGVTRVASLVEALTVAGIAGSRGQSGERKTA